MNVMSASARRLVLTAAVSGLILAVCPAVHAADQNGVAAAVKAKLSGKQYQNVQVSVDDNGVATLSGTVDLYEYKNDADEKTHKVNGVKAVRNDIEVAGSATDSAIEKRLGPELAYSREGYGNLFDAIILHVQNGVVALSGHAHDYPDRDAAVALAATTPGVKEVIDDIEVDPPSPMDNRIRMAVARAIYSYPALSKYAIDPIRPIRISVQNAHVELYGTVDSAMDKRLAYLRASLVPGIFSVKNYIQVEGKNGEKQDTE